MKDLVHVGTLRNLHAEGTSFWVLCANWRGGCSHAAVVAIESLIQHLGWDFPYIEERLRLRQLLVCSKCGHRWPELQLHRPGVFGGAGFNGHSLTSSGGSAPVPSHDISYAESLEHARAFREAHPEPSVKYGGKRRRHFR